jgi:ribosomal protein S18 acetylase RimI-like enzyme
VAAGGIELRPTIDRGWLIRTAAAEPVEHAYALWDLDRHPGRVRFLSALRDGRTVGYFLLWPGPAGVPIVHAYAPGDSVGPLVEQLPPRPLVAIVAPSAAAAVRTSRGPAREFPERILHRPWRASGGSDAPGVRRLAYADGGAVGAWARHQAAPETAEYVGLDLADEVVWGAFDRGRLVGIARAEIRLPYEWVIAGVFVEPAARGRGHGAALVDAAVRAAAAAKASVGLFVRDDRPAARRLYARHGFVEVGQRVWMDLGAGFEP